MNPTFKKFFKPQNDENAKFSGKKRFSEPYPASEVLKEVKLMGSHNVKAQVLKNKLGVYIDLRAYTESSIPTKKGIRIRLRNFNKMLAEMGDDLIEFAKQDNVK